MPIHNPPVVEAPTKEFFVPVTYSSSGNMSGYDNMAGANCTAFNHYGRCVFKVPDDFNAIVSVEMIVVPRATQAAANWDIDSNYGAVGQSAVTHTEIDNVTTYNVTNAEIYAVDLAGILSALTAGDIVGTMLIEKTVGHDLTVLGVRFKYS